ncbi:MAG: CRISPR-associated protein Cas4 [Dehalococcoidales bacterium]|nr:CRISPR-associated protein Cas4 [Dehalococcoidales bacterium]
MDTPEEEITASLALPPLREAPDLTYVGEDEGEVEVLVSAIEHYSYCPRQCALIHLEQTFEENLFTVRGRLAHERVDSGDDAASRGVPTARSVPVWSWRLGLYGMADLIEFRPEGPYPVEYKSGRRKGVHADLQLCAQALCLEEMLGVAVPKGALYYHATRKRHEVVLDDDLRRQTVAVIEGVREMLREERLPVPPNDARCPNCSLVDACLPGVAGEPARLRGLQGALFHPWEPSAAGGEDW